MYLSYSGYKCATSCLYHYWHSYIGHTSFAKPDDRLGSIYGTVVGRLFEAFYKGRLWREPGSCSVLSTMADTLVMTVLEEEQKPRKGRPAGVIEWRENLYASAKELLSDVQAAIPRGLATIKVHRLLGLNVEAELKLDSDVGKHRVGGRADFVMTRIPPHRDLVILDGKGSRKRDRYVDGLQLQWYAWLYREQRGRLPDRAAFVYWHFEPPTNIDWCTFKASDIEGLKNDVLKFMDRLEDLTAAADSLSLPLVRTIFTPSAKMSNCRFCPYATEQVCPKGFEVVTKESQRANNAWQT